MILKNPLADKEFLKKLDLNQNRLILARITSLDLKDTPMDEITGRVTGGDISVNGASAIRRACNLSLIAQDLKINDYYWGLETKIKVEIGVENNINQEYPPVIWFPMGIYLLTQFSTNYSASNISISLSGQDKMTYLNGTAGGIIPFTTDFSIIKDLEFGTETKLPIKTILTEMLHQYGKEPYYNLILDDIPDFAKDFVFIDDISDNYIFNDNICLFIELDKSIYKLVNKDDQFIYEGTSTTIDELLSSTTFKFIRDLQKPNEGTEIIMNEEKGKLAKINITSNKLYGYRETDLIYAEELIGDAGQPLTTILDKVKSMLGDFEYFYDLEGRFVFQEKRTFLNKIFSFKAAENPDILIQGEYSYNFDNAKQITSYSKTPSINAIKNDFCVWGERKSMSGNTTIPICMRYSIHRKPEVYWSFAQDKEEVICYYYANENLNISDEEKNIKESLINKYFQINSLSFKLKKVDWRELIYQMALDYKKYGTIEDKDNVDVFSENYNLIMKELNPDIFNNHGQSGYEIYYQDLLASWRTLYDPDSIDEEKYFIDTNDPYYGWAKSVYEDPNSLTFWLDFLDINIFQGSELEKFSISKIGERSLIKTENKISLIKAEPTAEFAFIFNNKEDTKYPDFAASNTLVTVPWSADKAQMVSRSNDAETWVNQAIYNNTLCTETINITAVPIYYLEPNTLINISIGDRNIDGDYIINSINYSLLHNGMMTINAIKKYPYIT